MVACLVDVVKLSIKSGIAREQGSIMPSPPAVRFIWQTSRAWWGRTVTPTRSEMKLAMIWLVAEVKVHSSRSRLEGGC